MYLNVTVSLLLAALLGGAIAYIVREKKKGRKCIGCPYSGQCGRSGTAECSCKSDSEN